VEVIDPMGQRPLSLLEAVSTPSLRLTQAGFYQLRRASGHQQLIGVNIDPRESDLEVIPDEVLALWQHRPAAQNAAAVANEPLRSPRQPYPLWWFILLLALATVLAQDWVAARHLGTQREQT